MSELLQIIKNRSFHQGHFRFAGGKEGLVYFNMKATMMHPTGAELPAYAMLNILDDIGITEVSGLEMGAVPIIGAMLALRSGRGPISATFVRKQAKKYGLQSRIEGLAPGESLQGRNVAVLDDVATSGNSLFVLANVLRWEGAKINHAACLIDRQEGASEFLAEHGITLHSVFKAKDFQ